MKKHIQNALTLSGLLITPALFAQQRPNVVIILADDMGYGDIQCNNPYARTLTPAIDQLAAEGIRFTEAHSAGALSGPSRYGLVTGRYFFREEVHDDYYGYLQPFIQPDRLTIGEMMKQAGYHTACIGKWHLGMNWETKDKTQPQILDRQTLGYTNTDFSKPVTGGPASCGFDYSFILPASLDMPPYVFVKNSKVIDSDVILTADAYPNTRPDTEFDWDRKYTTGSDIYWERGMWWRNGEMSRSFKFEDCLPTIVEEGISFIDRAGKKKKPFFLYMPLTGPHTPWLPTEEAEGKTEMGCYGDFICDIDDCIRRVDRKLEELGIKDNTIVIFASDNGSAWDEKDVMKYGHQSNWSRRGMKGDAWDGGHHVPLIVRWPEQIKQAGQSSCTVSLADLFATLADITGETLPAGQAEDSFSFKSILEGKLDTEIREDIIYFSGSHKLAIKRGKWKYIECLGSAGFSYPVQVKPEQDGPQGQLYNMETDSMETTNLILQEPEIAKELAEALKRYVEQGHSRPM